jgi:hypothetical protein
MNMNTNTNIAMADAVNTNITNIITIIATMIIADATNTKAIATKAVPATAEKTAMRSKKIWSLSGSAPQFLL